MHYVLYCDESEDKGEFFSDFYGGALIEASRRQDLENLLKSAKSAKLQGELKWTKISEYNEKDYCVFIDKFFELIKNGFIKMRVMFTQNVNTTHHVKNYEPGTKYFKLYYQFIKHAFGLRFCNPGASRNISVTVLIDNAPDTASQLENFKNHLSSLSNFSVFKSNRIKIRKDAIMEVVSDDHIILQAVDIVLGSIQFRLNNLHKAIPEGKKRRGKRTRAKERVYKHILSHIQSMYPNFNVGISTGQSDSRDVRWRHPYRHWCFIPKLSIRDDTRSKRAKRQAPQPPT